MDTKLKKYKFSHFLLLWMVLCISLFSFSCSFTENHSMKLYQASLSLRIPRYAPWIQKAGKTRVLGFTDKVHLLVKNDKKEMVFEETYAGKEGDSEGILLVVPLPEGTGYTLELSLYNFQVSRQDPTLQGWSSPFSVKTGISTPLTLYCTPVEPEELSLSSTPDFSLVSTLMDKDGSPLKGGGEMWFRFTAPVSGESPVPKFTPSPAAQVYFRLFKDNGRPIGSWSRNGEDVFRGLNSGEVYYLGVFAGSTDSQTNISLSVEFPEKPGMNNVIIPDANFKACLVENTSINTNGDTEIQYSEAQAFAGEIDVANRSIDNLTGIEAFTTLTGLDCSSNQLTTLDMSHNTVLTGLDCSSNQLTTLDMSHNTTLTGLDCSSNQLTILDVSHNAALTGLDCSSNQLTTLDMSHNTALTGLDCSSNQLTTLDMSHNTALTGLDCSSNQLTTLDMSHNAALTGLDCSSNQLTILDVSHNAALTGLDCSSNQLTSLDVSHNTVLTGLDCRENLGLTKIYIRPSQHPAPSGWLIPSGAQYQYLGNVTIPDANFKACLVENTSINTNGDTEIQYSEAQAFAGQIDAKIMNISDLTGIEAFTVLTGLDCGSNQLTTLDVSHNTALTRLDCGSNQLTTLDVSHNTALTELDCGSNQLTTLDVSHNTDLTELSCGSNQLTTLDVSHNTVLTGLDCRSNQLTSLDVRTIANLETLDCRENPGLTKIYIRPSQHPAPSDWLIPSGIQYIWDIAIPDANFKSYLVGETSININGDDEIQNNEAQAFAGEIDVANRSINNLAGIEAFTALTKLTCYQNSLSSLDLSHNTALTNLNCSYNQLTTLDATAITNLINLNCTGNTSLIKINIRTDQSPPPSSWHKPSGARYVWDIAIPDANFKSYLIGNSYINTNGDSEIQNTEAQAYANFINVTGKNISDLTGIEAFTALKTLKCTSNQLSSLDLEHNTQLENLNCAGNQLTALNIQSNPQLKYLVCSQNSLTSLDVSQNTALEKLTCFSNSLTSLDLSSNTNLKELSCSQNSLTSLDLTQNTVLEFLSCSGNELTSLDVSQNTALTNLSCGQNQLTSLDISSNSLLEELICSINQLTSLDVSSNTALTSLSCGSNSLTTLDVNSNTMLEVLSCGSNPLTNLNINNNAALTQLQCGENQLTSLDVSQNGQLTQLECHDNQLTTLDVSTINNLRNLKCTGNPGLTKIYIRADQSSPPFSWEIPSGAQYIWDIAIPDANFKSYLVGETSININGDGEIQNNEAQAFAGEIDVANQSINNLAGIEAFTALTKLTCYQNSLSSLDLSHNTALTELDCSATGLSSLDVSSNTALTSLQCYSNQLTSLDVSHNTALTNLNCSYNQLTTLDVSTITALATLDCTENPNLTTIYIRSEQLPAPAGWLKPTAANYVTK